MIKCEVLGKEKQFGDQHQHSRRSGWRFRAPRTKRTWDVNSRTVKVTLPSGERLRIRMSMKAYKRYRKDGLDFLKKHGVI